MSDINLSVVNESESSEQDDPKYSVIFQPRKSELGQFRLIYIKAEAGYSLPPAGKIAESLAASFQKANPEAHVATNVQEGHPAWSETPVYRAEVVTISKDAPAEKGTRQTASKVTPLEKVLKGMRQYVKAGDTPRDAFYRSASENDLSEAQTEAAWTLYSQLTGQ